MSERSVLPGFWNTVTPLFYGYQQCPPKHSFGPAVRSCYLLHYVFDGRGTFYKNGHAYPVSRGDVFVIAPEELTTYTADEQEPWRYCWVGFRCAQSLPFLSSPVIHIPALQKTFEGIRHCVSQEQDTGRIYAWTYEMLCILSDQQGTPSPRVSDYAAYAKMHLNNTYMTPITIESIAKTLHIDRRYLTSVFRKAYGCSPQEYLMRLRLEKAKSFLQAGHSVSQSAVMAGFTDLSNFSRKYKQFYGISPREQA